MKRKPSSGGGTHGCRPGRKKGRHHSTRVKNAGTWCAGSQCSAALLARGYTLRDIARRTGRSYATLRWHLSSIFIKRGLSHQVELVRLVLSLSPVAATLR